ncbi:MAG: hypothetical protein B0D92_00825 [Spirochaeta sp. LUC14_002_19_P3]|nr:MAG: hypothetical protein B0D92_00825 [Spirochaeta sp. LUC14_002_19_P3]
MKQIVLFTAAFILMAASLLVLAACNSGTPANGTPAKSSSTDITELIVTVGSTDYTVNFNGTAGSVFLPMAETVPGSITVKSAALAAGASGLTAAQVLTLSGSNVEISITAEDGTVKTYTLTVAKKFAVSSVDKITPATDFRWHYVLFTIASGDKASNLGRHKLVLKPKADSAPTAAEAAAGAGVTRNIKGTEKRVFLAYPINSTIKTFTETHQGTIKKHGQYITGNTGPTYDIDSLLLRPNTAYTLYALKEGGTEVEALMDFTTDTFPAPGTLPGNQYVNDKALDGDYTYDDNDPVFVFPVLLFGHENATVTYQVNLGTNTADTTLGYTFGATDSPLISSIITDLLPSEGTDGSSVDNDKNLVVFAVYPQSSLGTHTQVKLSNSFGVVFTMNLAEDL